jgi:hypothetical protein
MCLGVVRRENRLSVLEHSSTAEDNPHDVRSEIENVPAPPVNFDCFDTVSVEITQEIMALRPNEQIVIFMTAAGATAAEMAQRLNITRGAALNLLCYARKKLKGKLPSPVVRRINRCLNGHIQNAENLRDRAGSATKCCRLCYNESQKRWRAKSKEDAVKIPLFKSDLVVLVDREDYDRLALGQYRWFEDKGRNTIYAACRIKGDDRQWRTFRMHNMIMLPALGEVVDHENLSGLDNRKKNLRRANRSQNGGNVIARSKTGYKGVYPHGNKSFRARLQGQHLGTYKTKEEAARAYDEKAREVFGKFARCNFEVAS